MTVCWNERRGLGGGGIPFGGGGGGGACDAATRHHIYPIHLGPIEPLMSSHFLTVPSGISMSAHSF